MGLGVAGLVALSAAFVGGAVVLDSMEDGRRARSQAAQAQRDTQKVQRANNAQDAARERRQLIREERVKRARVMQAAENTGTSESSGQLGAIGGLATQLGSNLGFNLGKQEFGEQFSIFAQARANAEGDLASAQYQGQIGQMLVNQSGNIGNIGGYVAGSSIFKPQDPLAGFFKTGTSGD